MRKIFALIIGISIILVSLSNLTIVTGLHFEDKSNSYNKPDVVKNQFLIESAKITDIGMQAAKDTLVLAFSENITEADVGRAAADAMVGSGSSDYVEAFGVMVASGDQSAIPHGDASDDDINLILPGEVVVVDLGARYRGYCTDLTRTFFMGEPTAEMMEIYNITLEAQLTSMESVQSGELARNVDKVARDIITKYGYGDNFTHGLGHGIGLYVHMPPTLQPSSNEVLFKSGDMAVTIEPGIYLTGRFGVRIEDDVLVTRSGYILITHFPKGLEEAILLPKVINGSLVLNTTTSSKGAENFDYSMLILGIVIISVVFIAIIKIKRSGSSKQNT